MKAVHLSFALLLACHCNVAQANDWPGFRGADRSDIQTESGLLKKWPKDGPKKLWMSEEGGLGYAGFSIVNGTVYTMGANDDFEEFLLALDAKTGEEKWRTAIGARYTNRWGDGPRGTPAVDGEHVYTLGARGDVICVKAADGKEVWKANLVEEYGGKLQNWGYTESLLVDGDRVICTPGGEKGTLLALNKKTGKKIWQTKDWTDVAQYSSPLVVEHQGVRQYIQRSMTNVAGIEAETGKVLWMQPFAAGKVAVIPTPVYADGKVYVSAGYGVGCMMFEIGANKPKVVYENTNMVNHHGGVILVGKHLYGYSDKGGWTCQDFATGEVVWQEKKLGKGAIHCADGQLYLLEETSGTVVLIDASPDGWKEHGRFVIEPQTEQRAKDGRIWTHPVVSNGQLYLRDQELIFAYAVK
ncbi:polyvinylalcohol dehydrogenase [Phragmitibacter flavus]|uniref:Polyvinylalcohol dehydrogenase n=1 Tax=Phragmitibacter flavus TaxID=2576071 RepID=A0A5R8KKH3_9BACT|nr:PQQ-binding-like beta-propeller repeat protein [Phragmitibacter flavus]TLD72721.1 polyvinylalcohol dehydrogenase [Phragmitibacter flavus]